ncbi:MAG: Rossmann-like and DUF2520 domain-containing protein [Bacteroidales bacterium]
MSHKISFTGSGNVGTNLARTLFQHGYKIESIISRHIENARQLAAQVNACPGTSLNDLDNNSDILLFAVSDDVLPEILEGFDFGDKVLIHTAGSLSLDTFQGHSKNYGVLYPLQTFSKHRVADFMNLPVFIEANNNYALSCIRQIAEKISRHVYVVNSEERLRLHTAAVFACNFVNHMYSIAEEIVSESGMGIEIFEPLIRETADKALRLGDPAKSQTGPALRNDKSTMDKHLTLLKDNKDLYDLYKILSNRIFETSIKERK